MGPFLHHLHEYEGIPHFPLLNNLVLTFLLSLQLDPGKHALSSVPTSSIELSIFMALLKAWLDLCEIGS